MEDLQCATIQKISCSGGSRGGVPPRPPLLLWVKKISEEGRKPGRCTQTYKPAPRCPQYYLKFLFSLVSQMEQGLAELRKIFIMKVDEVIEQAKNTNEIEAALPSVRVCRVYK